MHFTQSTIVAFSLLASSSLVAGHGAIVAATGDAGGQGSAIGVVPTTPRDGTGRNPFQQDSTRFRGAAAASCGETLGGGDNDVESGTAQVMALNGDTLPQITPGGEISMTVHQVNGDGAGPYKCMIDATGTGTNWQPITVTQNLEGNDRGRNRDTQMQDLPLTAAIPANQECTGTVAGQTGVCMVRCENPARAGPFGGCVPVQMAAAAVAPATGATGNVNDNTQTLPQGQTGNIQQGTAGNVQQGTTGTVQQGTTGNIQQGTIPQQTNGNIQQGTTGTVPQQVAPVSNNNLNGNVAGGASTGTLPSTGGVVARARRAIKSNPVLTNDDQEEEVDLLD